MLLVKRALTEGGLGAECDWVQAVEEVPDALARSRYDIVLSDFELPGKNGLASVEAVTEAGLDIPVILVSGTIGEEAAVRAMRAGVRDYIMKDNLVRLAPAVRRELAEAEARRERRGIEETLESERLRAQVTLASIAEGVVRIDDRLCVEYLNPSAERLTGWTCSEARGQPVEEVVQVVDAGTRAPLQLPVVRALRERRSQQPSGQRLLRNRNGDVTPIRDSAAPISGTGEGPSGVVLVLRDLAWRRAMERQVSTLSRYDPGTHLLNRRSFELDLRSAFREAEQSGRDLSLVYVDIDRFNVVNETEGPVAGDAFLREIAETLRSGCASTDVVGRLGGDEFGILLPDCDRESAFDRSQRLAASIAKSRFEWANTKFRITASVGVAALDEVPSDPSGLMTAAESACLMAKESGGDRVHQHRTGDESLVRRTGEAHWIPRLQRALDRDEFRLYSQPMVPIGPGNRPVIHEVLLRLETEDGDLVVPGQFLPAAERYHMMPELDRWVIETVLRTLAELGLEELGAHFSINLSGQSLTRPEFLEFLSSEVIRSNMPAARLCFEITETAAIADFRDAVRLIELLQGLGCRFALDDFGSGVSSFNYLQALPVDYLKIDGGLVRHCKSDPVQKAIVESVAKIGRLMGIATISECVEDEETAHSVAELGVDYAQGYWFGRPAPLVRENLKTAASYSSA